MCLVTYEMFIFSSSSSFSVSPLCSSSRSSQQGVALQESLDLVCDVLARPKNNLKFHWSFFLNNSAASEDMNNLNLLSNYVSNGTRSVLTFSPTKHRDYGTVLCFANNEIGRQRKACVFNIVPAGK